MSTESLAKAKEAEDAGIWLKLKQDKKEYVATL